MGANLRKLTISALAAGLAAVLMTAPAAQANRGTGTTTTTVGYVPPPVDVPQPTTQTPVEPTVVPVDLPTVSDPGTGVAGGGEQLAPAPSSDNVLAGSEERPVVQQAADSEGIFGGVLSRTGAETLPLARAGLGAIALGIGLVMLARRRRAEATSA